VGDPSPNPPLVDAPESGTVGVSELWLWMGEDLVKDLWNRCVLTLAWKREVNGWCDVGDTLTADGQG